MPSQRVHLIIIRYFLSSPQWTKTFYGQFCGKWRNIFRLLMRYKNFINCWNQFTILYAFQIQMLLSPSIEHTHIDTPIMNPTNFCTLRKMPFKMIVCNQRKICSWLWLGWRFIYSFAFIKTNDVGIVEFMCQCVRVWEWVCRLFSTHSKCWYW